MAADRAVAGNRQMRKSMVAIVIMLIAALFGAVEALIVRSYVESSRITATFASNVDSTTFLANVQREFFLYQRLLMDLPIEDWDTKDIQQRRSFLMRQVDLLANTGDSPGFVTRLKAVRYKLMSVNGLVRDPSLVGRDEAHIKAELNKRLTTLELHLKRAFDAEETVLFTTMNEVTEGREKSQRFLVLLAGMVFLISTVMITLWSRSVRSRLSTAFSSLMTEMEERSSLEKELTHQAFHDPLTGLANRELFRNDLKKAMSRGERNPGSVGMLYLDLDDFKKVNDTLGHDAGDKLLKQVAGCINEVIRPSDTAARLGGDEFAIVLDEIGDLDQATRIAERLFVALRNLPELEKELSIQASIGIALQDLDAADIDHLINNADRAMYEAKLGGKNVYRVYDPEMAKRAADSVILEKELRNGIAEGQLELHYQPLISLSDGATVGYEALVRWNHPTRGLLQPHAFVGLAEETGLIVTLDKWALNAACSQIAEWKRRDAGFEPRHISVNVSAKHFEDADVVEDVSRALRSSQLDPSALHLELTESTLMNDKDSAAVTLKQLKELGVSISLDDFGTGYSSLSYLKNFDLDTLKIDRSFVAGVASGPEESALTRAIVQIAQTLHLQIVAEGIETAAQAAELHRLGCQIGQGFLFSHPLPATEIEGEISARLGFQGILAAPRPSLTRSALANRT